MTVFDMSARYSPSPDAIESRLGDETVILHLVSGTYFGLDVTGTMVWEAINSASGATHLDACNHVRASFEDVPESMEADVMAFMTRLAEHDLIRGSEPGRK